MNRSRPSRRRGGQPGNTNAVRHGYYSRFFNPSETKGITRSPSAGSLQDEIDLLRILLRRVAGYVARAEGLEQNLVLLKTVCQATTSLAHLIRLQALLAPSGEDQRMQMIREAIRRVREADHARIAANEAGLPDPTGGYLAQLLYPDSQDGKTDSSSFVLS